MYHAFARHRHSQAALSVGQVDLTNSGLGSAKRRVKSLPNRLRLSRGAFVAETVSSAPEDPVPCDDFSVPPCRMHGASLDFGVASGIEGGGVGSGSCLSGEGGEQSVLDKWGARHRVCTHTVAGSKRCVANILFYKIVEDD